MTRFEEISFDTAAGWWLELGRPVGEVLRKLIAAEGRPIAASALRQSTYRYRDGAMSENQLKVYVSHLRHALEDLGYLTPIETVRGQGYRLAVDAASIRAAVAAAAR